MGDKTLITWTDMTFNPWIGCTKISAGCTNCYAERDNKRYGWVDRWGPQGTRRRTSEANWKKPLAWNRQAEKDGVRRKVFCASLADVFEDRDELNPWRVDLFNLIIATPNLDWLVLTKRPENVIKMTLWCAPGCQMPDNVWMGTTCENQEMADKRLPILLDIPARIRFVSVEPMLGKIDFADATWNTPDHWSHKIDWVIFGGESGPDYRPMNVDWLRDGIHQCQKQSIPVFVKQLGGWPNTRHLLTDFPEDLRVREFPERG